MSGKVSQKGEVPLLLALARGDTILDASRAAGVSEKTVNRRLADPGLRQQVADLRSEMVSRALGKMAEGKVEAAETLRKLLSARSESVRLGAARSLLELGVRLRDSAELEKRVRDVEELLAREDPE